MHTERPRHRCIPSYNCTGLCHVSHKSPLNYKWLLAQPSTQPILHFYLSKMKLYLLLVTSTPFLTCPNKSLIDCYLCIASSKIPPKQNHIVCIIWNSLISWKSLILTFCLSSTIKIINIIQYDFTLLYILSFQFFYSL